MGNLMKCPKRQSSAESQKLAAKAPPPNQDVEAIAFIQLNEENHYTTVKYRLPPKSKYSDLVKIIKDRYVIEDTNQIDVSVLDYDHPQNQLFLNHKIAQGISVLAQIQSKVRTKKTRTRPLVVGISGPSQSGKTTIYQSLKLHMDVDYVQQDWFYDEKVIKEFLHNNWESPDAINWSNMIEEIDNRVAQTDKNVLIIDGHQIFHRKEIVDRCDIKIYLDINELEMYKRRMKYKRMKEYEFRENLIPETRKYAAVAKKLENITIIDTSKPIKETYAIITKLIEDRLNQTEQPAAHANLIEAKKDTCMNITVNQ